MEKRTGSELSRLTQLLPCAVIGADAGARIDVWNPAAEKLFGWNAEEVLGQPMPSGWNLGSEEPGGRSWSRVLQSKDGKNIDAEVQAEDREGGGWLLTASSVSNQAESRFRELLEAAPDSILEVDRDGRIVLLNAVTEVIFGYKRDELLGEPVERLLPESAAERHRGHRAAYWANPVTRPMGHGMTLLARRKDGSEFPVEISLSPVAIDDGFRVTAIIRDVTLQKKVQEDLRSANQQLEMQNRELDRASRLKSEFLASMSHELRTPLHTIIGFTELLNEEIEGPLNEKQKRFLNHVYQDSQHLLELINDILDLSKVEAGQMVLHPEQFDAADLIEEAVSGIIPMAQDRGIQVETHVEREAIVSADRTRFREILSNLLSNAVKFTPAGGTVSVERQPDVTGFLVFSVSDTGIGIAPEDHEAVFDKFRQISSTTRGVREGTGLGLAIVRSFVEMHGGAISLESAPGEGSKFIFSIPAGVASQPSVLVIEDEPNARELLSSYLEPLGIKTHCAGTADEGVRMARDLKPDAITLDLLMPGKSGWRGLRELRLMPETAGIPVFVISVLDELPPGVSHQPSEYLQKPLRKEALLQALKKHAPVRFNML